MLPTHTLHTRMPTMLPTPTTLLVMATTLATQWSFQLWPRLSMLKNKETPSRQRLDCTVQDDRDMKYKCEMPLIVPVSNKTLQFW